MPLHHIWGQDYPLVNSRLVSRKKKPSGESPAPNLGLASLRPADVQRWQPQELKVLCPLMASKPKEKRASSLCPGVLSSSFPFPLTRFQVCLDQKSVSWRSSVSFLKISPGATLVSSPPKICFLLREACPTDYLSC